MDLLIQTLGLAQKGVTVERINQLEVAVYERVRQRTQIKTDEGMRSSNAFKFLDI